MLRVQEAAAQGFLNYLSSPAGRTPPAAWTALSRWFLSLPIQDQMRVREVVSKAFQQSLYATLCVLDGLTKVDASDPNSVLRLTIETSDQRVILAESRRSELVDLFKSLTE